MSQKISLVYFSGTGGTERIANAFESDLIRRGYSVEKINLDRSKKKAEQQSEIPGSGRDAVMLILVYPVYAVDAPPIVYDWIEKAKGGNVKTVVISVSGGGEVWPNTGCRNKLCKALESQGFRVFYEKMMVMPANCITPTKDELAMWLLKAVPEKTGKILDRVLEGKTRRTSFPSGPVKTILAKSARSNYHKFAENLKITSGCNSCGICSRNCPAGNITLSDRKPVFGGSCIMCLRCIYNCPQKAIKTKQRLIFKTGFSLERIEKEMGGVELQPVEKLARGPVWAGVKNYLLDIDGY